MQQGPEGRPSRAAIDKLMISSNVRGDGGGGYQDLTWRQLDLKQNAFV